MPSARKIDDNGFVLIEGCPISSFGIFDYSAAQLGLPGDPNRIVKVYRPESAINDPAAIESFKNVPFIIDHEMLSGFEDDDGAEAPENYGVDGVLTSNVYYDKPWMRGDIKIFSRKAQRALAQKKRDLSLGYACDFEVKPGVWEGQPYEVIQYNMRGNHIALVMEGRVPGARVLDGLCFDHLNFDAVPSDEGSKMPNLAKRKKAADNAVEQLKALIPALNQFLAEEMKEPEHQGEPAPAVAQSENDMSALNVDNEGEAEAAAQVAATAAANEAGEGTKSEVELLIEQAKDLLTRLEAVVAAEEGGMNNEGEAGNGEGEASGEGENANDTAEAANGKASPGPEAGKHAQAGDAAVGRFYADLAAKDRIYKRLSNVVGAFDHATMDARQVAAYGVKKLKINAPKGQESVALDAYLTGVELGAKSARKAVQAVASVVGDSRNAPSSELDAYINGGQ
ncbi:hypothetical protein [Xanthomonas phage Carpasina]|uniref:Uncharacterized protein n=1 Tax=Xanthomonas phage Carpasina TaxID=2163636 RepID=A0A2S1GSP3_9CAUD|nr:head maturation protease [Xanthomonas phage Carpasina]AWD92403.1 hypothetical protein [Xanthomonas phage Carpasina]